MTLRSKPSVVITGASTGIGESCVAAALDAGFLVLGSVRRESDARRLAARYGADFAPLFFDVADGGAIARAAAEVETRLRGETLAGLVNNAGVAVPGPLLHLPIEEFQRQMEINLIGQLRVVQAFAPLLGAGEKCAGPPGRIVNMSSVAGTLALPLLGAYAASKHALEGFSDALRRELMIYGVDVIVVQPGVIATPIWDKAKLVDFSRYDATIYGPAARDMQKWAVERGRSGPPPSLVAAAVMRALTARNPPARIRVVPRPFLDWVLPRMLPARILDRLIARRLGFRHPRGTPPGEG
jgi:NAD(P)-dependent dehydrogenase (short-subunit alcohol dehydrogenase family)